MISVFWIVTAALIISTPQSAHAYLVPLIGGLGWLIGIILGGLIFFATFIWIHVLKLKRISKKDGDEEKVNQTETDKNNDSSD